jgi:ribonuclease BN (tRNA processing enzyme)
MRIAGPSSWRSNTSFGYKPEQTDEIYLTHLHADHIGGEFRLDAQPLFL